RACIDYPVDETVFNPDRIIWSQFIQTFDADITVKIPDQISHVFKISSPVRAEQDPLSGPGHCNRLLQHCLPVRNLLLSTALEKPDHDMFITIRKNMFQTSRFGPGPVSGVFMC